MRVGVLGSVGLLVLVYTVLTLIQKIEQVFNYTWRAEENRPFAQRFSQYLSVLLIGPVLFFSAVGLSASLQSSAFVEAVLAIEPFGSLIEDLSKLVPYLLLAFAFAFIYVFVPNVRVRFRSAMIGALVAALLWQGVGYVFAKFMVGSTQYMAIYSSLAILVLFMIWVYIAWLILLIGASIAFYHQHPEYLASRSRDLVLSNRLRERLGLLLAGHITQRYLSGEEAWTADALVEALEVPRTNIARMLGLLERAGFLVRTAHPMPRYLLTQAPEGITVKTLLDGIRCYEERYTGCRGTAPDAAIAAVEARVEQAVDDALGGMTLRDLAGSLQAPRPAVQESRVDAADGESAQVPALPLPGPPMGL
jgi:membrane protein